MGADKAEQNRAEHHIFAELLNHGVLPYRAAGGGLWLNTPAGCRLELRAVLRQAQDERLGNGEGGECRFAVADFQPRPELFFLCVEFDGDEVACVWVLPSIPFFVYSDADDSRGTLELNLDAKQERYFDQPFREYNSCFRNRWEAITQFDLYRPYMKRRDAPDFAEGWENFEDCMLMLEADENWEPDEESITWEQYAAELAPALPD